MIGVHDEIWAKNPGCMTQTQIIGMQRALKRACEEPSLLCDLEGCGPIAELEKEFALICGTHFALTVSSGTAAIHTALLALGIGAGDEVIVTPYSWAQSIAPVIYTGATPVFADIDPDTLNIDPKSVLDRISHRTRAILPVHLFGHTADMVRLEEIARNTGVFLISDAAHALGAKLHDRPIGRWGDMACFSLTRGKIVSGGEGGIIVTNNEEIFERAVSLSQHPERVKRIKGLGLITDGLGLNYRLHSLSALLALCDLKDMKKRFCHRKSVFEQFWEGLEASDIFTTQPTISGEDPAPYGIALTFEKENGRDELVARIQDKGVPLRCGPVGIPLHLRLSNGPAPHPPFHSSQRRGACPIAEEHCKERELWVLSALDMDGISPQAAYAFGVIIREETKNMFAVHRGQRSGIREAIAC